VRIGGTALTVAAGVALAVVGPPAVRGDDGPVVNLADRVPARWLDGRSDRLPLTPARWRRRLPRECRTRGGYRDHCQGERRVPTPTGPAAELAGRLALGHGATALQLRLGPPFEEWAAAAAGTDPDPMLTFPVPEGILGRGYGRVRGGELAHRRHFGIDIGADEGAEVIAARGGLVVYSDNGLVGYGNSVMLLHEDGFTTFYAHCLETLVFAGQKVRRGQRIARVGRTGFAPAPHLHFEWRQRGWARDPVPQMYPR
jgi:murein DD-endopeptidase MepM/ murein hydrolase activator NlpD